MYLPANIEYILCLILSCAAHVNSAIFCLETDLDMAGVASCCYKMVSLGLCDCHDFEETIIFKNRFNIGVVYI